MKKFVKLSLVAAVAVAGLTTANAQPLEEAIKGVDISGTMVYRLNSYEENNTNNSATNTTATGNDNYYKLAVNISSPVNDDIKANTGFISGNTTTGDMVNLDSNTAGAHAGIALVKANFSYTGIANTTLIVGKQGITTPWSVGSDSDNDITTGTGILALSNVGPVTIAGAIFNQIKDSSFGSAGEDLGAVAVMGKVGPVALDAWYGQLTNNFDSFSIGAKASFDVDAVKLTVDARHTELTIDNNGALTYSASTDDNSLSKIMLSAKTGIFNAYLGYGETGKEGGTVVLGSGAAASSAEMVSWSNFLSGKADADMLMVGAGAQVLPTLNVALKYSSIDQKSATNDADETYFEGTWKPSKNFYTYLRAGQYTSNAGVDSNRARVQVQYSF